MAGQTLMQQLRAAGALVAATHNAGKVRELLDLLSPLGLRVESAGDLGLAVPDETETSFVGNAALKARAAAVATGRLALADDSGIEIAALNGAPGIYSADWAGEPRDFDRAMQRVRDEVVALGATDDRARFVSVLCLAAPDGRIEAFEGYAAGRLVWPPRGAHGFGYDPMFVPDGYAETFGEMEPQIKHAISHRAAAFAKFKLAFAAADL